VCVARCKLTKLKGETRHSAPGAPYRLFTMDCGPGSPTMSHPSLPILGSSLYWKAFAILPDSNFQSWVAKSIDVDFDLGNLCPYLCLCLVLCLFLFLCPCRRLALVLCYVDLRIDEDREQHGSAVQDLDSPAKWAEVDRQAFAFVCLEM